jgi:beta-phosphoglucomutase-like phosphatase (HAD superfamily)
MTTRSQLTELMRPVRHLMLDFDGPMCHVFAGRPAPGVADRLRALIAAEQDLPAELAQETDPLGFYRYTPQLSPDLAMRVTRLLRAEEVEAATTAELTPGVVDVMRACGRTGRVITVVSNNTPEAVQTFLTKHDLSKFIEHVSGRSNADPALMKPSPYLLQRAADAVGARLAASALVGDSTTDIQAAHAINVAAIGYANKPGKAEQFAELRAEAIITDMHELADAVLEVEPSRA